MHLQKGELVADRYKIMEVIGTGGMAIVYRAQDIKLEREITLKVLREEFNKDDDFIKRFSIEAKAAAKLNHKNIVSVYDVGSHKDINFIVMEYIEGANLKEIIKARGAFTNEETLGVAIQISEALEVAHKNNVIHRDIKPQNILVTTTGEIKVTDFGIAKAVNANTMTAANSTMGSVHYFSPEQARGGYVDQKSDIYALGISMYEMLTGDLPYEDETVVAVALKHLNDPLPTIKDKNIKADDRVIDIINKATEKRPAYRYTTEELTIALKRVLTKLTKPSYKEDEIELDTKIDTSTLKISEDDIKAVRSQAITAFYDNRDILELNRTIYGEQEKKTKDKSKMVILSGIIVAILIALLIFFQVLGYVNSNRRAKVDVPNLKGMTIEEAKAEAKTLNLNIEEVSQEFSDDIPKGEITDQNYLEGDILYSGDTIQVATSLGSDKLEVPDLVDMNTNDAYNELSRYPFVIEEIYEYNETIERNIIFKQEPTAGSMAVNGDTLTLYISIGEEVETVIVPNVVGTSESSAKAKINSYGLLFEEATKSYSSTVSSGYVIAQTLNAGTEALSGSAISIVVSMGPEPVSSPEPTESATPTPEPTDTSDDPVTDDEVGTTETTSETTEAPTTTPTATATPSDTVTTKSLTLSPVIDTEDPINVEVIAQNDSGGGQVVYNSTITKNEFPLTLSVTGSGVVRYTLYINGSLYGDNMVDFTE
ncbi:MAG: Stk1 family PASTA domain-containing Ser/Thr kinase [Lachnospirales bacterium]